MVSAKSQAFCRYGPSTAFLPNVDIFQGDTMAVNGRFQYGGWIWVKPDKVDRSCWIASIVAFTRRTELVVPRHFVRMS